MREGGRNVELIDKAALLNRIATEVHYDSEHSLEMYAKMLSLINDAPEVALTLVDANGNAVDCGRRIDADKLKKHYAWWAGGSQEMTLDRAKQIFDTIVDLQQTVDAEPQNTWFTVEERVPSNDDWVIVTIFDESGDTPYRYTDFGWYFDVANCWIVDAEQRHDVVAWMPLPKPYEERREDG